MEICFTLGRLLALMKATGRVYKSFISANGIHAEPQQNNKI
jgi:hypothetical protein